MNNYSRLEINLLPPELLPGPTVRYAMLINIMIILLTVTFIGLSSYIHWLVLNVAKDERTALEEQKASKAGVVADYERLNKIGMSIDRYGRLIALASEDYVEMPVVLDRISWLLPDEVYLYRVSNNRTEGQGMPVILTIQLTASDDNPELMIRTLSAFKNDPLFSDCFMPLAEYTEVGLDDMMDRYGINWSVSGPGVNPQVVARHYDFEIHSRVTRPLPILGVPVGRDSTESFASDRTIGAGTAESGTAATEGEDA